MASDIEFTTMENGWRDIMFRLLLLLFALSWICTNSCREKPICRLQMYTLFFQILQNPNRHTQTHFSCNFCDTQILCLYFVFIDAHMYIEMVEAYSYFTSQPISAFVCMCVSKHTISISSAIKSQQKHKKHIFISTPAFFAIILYCYSTNKIVYKIHFGKLNDKLDQNRRVHQANVVSNQIIPLKLILNHTAKSYFNANRRGNGNGLFLLCKLLMVIIWFYFSVYTSENFVHLLHWNCHYSREAIYYCNVLKIISVQSQKLRQNFRKDAIHIHRESKKKEQKSLENLWQTRCFCLFLIINFWFWLCELSNNGISYGRLTQLIWPLFMSFVVCRFWVSITASLGRTMWSAN